VTFLPSIGNGRFRAPLHRRLLPYVNGDQTTGVIGQTATELLFQIIVNKGQVTLFETRRLDARNFSPQIFLKITRAGKRRLKIESLLVDAPLVPSPTSFGHH